MTAQDKALKENTASAPLQIVAPGTCVETGEQAALVLGMYDHLVETIHQYNPSADFAQIDKAFRYADTHHNGQLRKDGSPFITHPLAVAQIIAEELRLDSESIEAALMHDCIEDTSATYAEIAKEFSPAVADLVEGVSKLTRVQYASKEEEQMENLRKMLMAMAKDIRVILIKISDRLHNMRTMEYQTPEKQKQKSFETMEIYAPIAHRLGMQKMKWELEDLSLKYLDPVGYREITEALDEKAAEYDGFMSAVHDRIVTRLKEEGIDATVYGRMKHPYSIYRKMYTQNKSLDDVFDLFAFRVIVDTVADCYNVLGIIHDLFKPILGRFKDYIGTPKPNMYQSLHTTVVGESGIPFEVQIRTKEMHEVAEYGVAAHWKYKEGREGHDKLDDRLAWVSQLLENQRLSEDSGNLLHDLKSDLLPEEVFAFTPRGDVINLPAGATVIDFAYAIHSAVGNRMIGAKVNNRIVPIDHQVVTGEIIEIITGPENRGPSRDWLNIVKTSEAKNKIRNWFKKERRDENIAEGKDAFEKELRRNLMVIPPEQYDEFMSNLARRNHCNSVDEMYAAIGYGGLQLARILPKLKEEYTRLKATEPKPLPTVDIKRVHSSDGVVVEGIDNCPIKFAKCCSPLPGDDIIGFVTRGFGVSIHKRDCANVQQSMKDPENAARWMKAYWADDAKEDYKATLELDCMDRANLLSDVALALGDMRVPIYSLSARAADQGRARMSLTVGIMNTVHLNNVVARLKKVKDVLTVTRN